MRKEDPTVREVSLEELRDQYICYYGGCQKCKSIKLEVRRESKRTVSYEIECLDCGRIESIGRYVGDVLANE